MTFAAWVTVAGPGHAHCGGSRKRQEFVLVMEDLAPARPGDQLRGARSRWRRPPSTK